MKKYSLSILIFLLCAVFIFSGCTKANSATPQSINELYQSIARKYGKHNPDDGKHKIFNEDMQIDLYSAQAYRGNVYNQITNLQDGASFSVANLLKKDGEYQPLMEAVSAFYNNRNFVATYVEIPQKLLTEMYEAIDHLDGVLKPLLSVKESFETMMINVNNPNSIAIRGSLKNYLESYRKLIQAMFKVNTVYEEIYTTCIYIPEENTLRLMDGELQRLVLSSSLYIAQYYYYKHFVLDTNLDNRFAHEKIFNPETNEIYTNPNYDSGYVNFVKVINNINNIADPLDMNDPDYLTYYNAAVSKLKSLKINIKNYQTAVEKVVDYKAKNNVETIPTNTEVYQYVNFINEMETQVVSYVNYLLLNIMDMA